MSDASRLARLAFSQRPHGTPYAKFQLSQTTLDSIEGRRSDAIEDASYSAVVSYVEAFGGIVMGSISWGIIRLYYSSFYSIKALLLLNGIVPFNGGDEMLLEIPSGAFLKGGRSSHHWNWAAFKRTIAKTQWFTSQDVQEAYATLRGYRENVNYTHGFTDPHLHSSLISSEMDLAKRFRVYRDDDAFSYTYLHDHLALAFPTKLIFEVEAQMKIAGLQLASERIDHLKLLWKLKDRCPLT